MLTLSQDRVRFVLALKTFAVSHIMKNSIKFVGFGSFMTQENPQKKRKQGDCHVSQKIHLKTPRNTLAAAPCRPEAALKNNFMAFNVCSRFRLFHYSMLLFWLPCLNQQHRIINEKARNERERQFCCCEHVPERVSWLISQTPKYCYGSLADFWLF